MQPGCFSAKVCWSAYSRHILTRNAIANEACAAGCRVCNSDGTGYPSPCQECDELGGYNLDIGGTSCVSACGMAEFLSNATGVLRCQGRRCMVLSFVILDNALKDVPLVALYATGLD